MPTSVSQITTFAQLKSAVADWLDRSDLTTVIPAFIQLAEMDMQNKLRHHSMETRSVANGQAGVGAVALPTDWLETRNVEADGVQLTYQSPDVMDMYRDSNPTETDDPAFYTYRGSAIDVWPVPSEDYDLQIDYYQTIPPLADAVTGTNWLLAASPGAYLYGALMHSAFYLRDDERAMAWQSLYDQALVLLQNQSDKSMISGSRLTRKAAVCLG